MSLDLSSVLLRSPSLISLDFCSSISFLTQQKVDKPSSEVILHSPPLNTHLPTLKAVENVGGESKWGQRSSMAKYKIVVDPTKSSARLTIHDNGFHLVLNHSITPQIKLEPYNKRDDSWVWTARDYSRNESGTVTTFQLRFADERVAAAFGEKFKEAQEMTKQTF